MTAGPLLHGARCVRPAAPAMLALPET